MQVVGTQEHRPSGTRLLLPWTASLYAVSLHEHTSVRSITGEETASRWFHTLRAAMGSEGLGCLPSDQEAVRKADDIMAAAPVIGVAVAADDGVDDQLPGDRVQEFVIGIFILDA